MRKVLLQGTEIHVSRLSFGTASLHHLPTGRQRQNLLAAAFEHGFTHFDTSPYYGLGIAERELGRFFKGRGGITVATKIGLYPPHGSRPSAISVWTRKFAGAVVPAVFRPVVDWSMATATRSLEASLACLGVECIDLLLLHEPSSDLVRSEVFLEWLQRERGRGRIRGWGLAGEVDRMDAWLSINHPLGMVLQVRDSLDRREADLVRSRGRDLQITYGYLSSSGTLPGAQPAAVVLEGALRRNARGSVLVSTRKLARVGELAAVAERDSGNAS